MAEEKKEELKTGVSIIIMDIIQNGKPVGFTLALSGSVDFGGSDPDLQADIDTLYGFAKTNAEKAGMAAYCLVRDFLKEIPGITDVIPGKITKDEAAEGEKEVPK